MRASTAGAEILLRLEADDGRRGQPRERLVWGASRVSMPKATKSDSELMCG